MDEPCGPEIASPGFQLQLEHSKSSSQMSQKNSSECCVNLMCSGNNSQVFLGYGPFCVQEMLEAFV